MQQTLWRIELLGWLRAEMGDTAVTRFATHNTAALLARLALWPRRAHSREELAELLWPEVASDAARGRLRQALTSLRHQLEPPGVESGTILIADRTHIRLNPSAICTDVADFDAALRSRHIEKARDLYKGELLPGFYEEWILDERERLAALFEQIETDLPGDAFPPSLDDGSLEGLRSEGASLPSPVVRLPLQFTRFFGRADELAKIGALLDEHRLVTLTGPGGAGKTRLSIEAARPCGAHRDIAFVGIADIASGASVVQLIAACLDAMRLPRESSLNNAQSAIDQLVEALQLRETLLVLDNAEHVADAAAQLALILLTRVPSLRILVSSRRRLHVAGEREFPVPALTTPMGDAEPTVETLALVAAVHLFVDRAQTVRPDFQLTRRNAADVSTLCRRLEGAPLAIELAAARAATLTPAQMVTHLQQRFEFLATRRSDKDARHRSLWAAISWSVGLLPAALGRLWKSLAVFRRGFTVESAAAITGESSIAEALTQLRERSLIVLEACETEMRFRLLESLREFAELEWDADDRYEIEKRHADYFLDLAQSGEAALRGADQAQWLIRLASEHDNVRAALAYGLNREDPEYAQRLAGSLVTFWERRGSLAEARMWLERSLALPGSLETPARAFALNRLGGVLNYCGSLDEASAIHRETLAICRSLNDERGVALAWNRLGVVATKRGDDEAAWAAFTEALARERTLGNQFNMAAAIINLGILAQKRNAFGEARELYGEALALFEATDNAAGTGDAFLNLAVVSMAEKQWQEAMPYLEKASAVFDALGDRWSGAYVMHGLGIIARHQNRLDDAATLAKETLKICREVGDRGKAADALRQLGLIARARGDEATSARQLQEALQIYRDLGQVTSAAECLRDISLSPPGPLSRKHLHADA